eukprot:331165-Prymnesium_polylepis.1
MSPGYRFLRGSHVLKAFVQPSNLHRYWRVPPTALDSIMYSRDKERGDTGVSSGELQGARELYKPSGM